MNNMHERLRTWEFQTTHGTGKECRRGASERVEMRAAHPVWLRVNRRSDSNCANRETPNGWGGGGGGGL